MEPTRSVPHGTIQTRTQTALEQGIPRRQFNHFGYSSESEWNHETVEQPVIETQQQLVFPEIDDLEPFLTDQEEILPEPGRSILLSPLGISAQLLSNPAPPDTLNSFPLFSSQAACSVGPESLWKVSLRRKPTRRTLCQFKTWHHFLRGVASRRGRPRGRPPDRRRRRCTT